MTEPSAEQPRTGPPNYGPPAGPPNYGTPSSEPPNYGPPSGPPNSGPPASGPPNYGPPYGQPRQYPALNGAAPSSAGLQIAAKLVEALIISIPIALLSMLAFVPFIIAIAATSYEYDSRQFPSGSLGEGANPLADDAGMIVAGLITTVAVMILIWLLLTLALVWWLAARGGSIGNAIFGLRLVSTETGRPIGWGKALLWYVVVVFGTLITGGILGLLFVLSPLFDTTSGWNQSWQDKMVGAVLINTRMGRDTIVG